MSRDELMRVLDALDPCECTPREARVIYRQARRLGRCDVLPGWLKARASTKTPLTSGNARGALERDVPAAISDREKCLAAKSAEHNLDHHYLRQVFHRGLVEYTRITRAQRLPITAEEHANARVNTFIRLYYGDPTARTDDADLLPLATRKRPKSARHAVSIDQSREG